MNELIITLVMIAFGVIISIIAVKLKKPILTLISCSAVSILIGILGYYNSEETWGKILLILGIVILVGAAMSLEFLFTGKSIKEDGE